MGHASVSVSWPLESQEADWASLSLLVLLQRDRGRSLIVGLADSPSVQHLARMCSLGLHPGLTRG
eukprot:4980960-Alexandrium_andersonii.AAC.1